MVDLDEELLLGGVMISEWCTFLVKESDECFANGTYLACIITAVSAIETYIRHEYSGRSKDNLFELIGNSDLSEKIIDNINILRKFRNMWVHVTDPSDDVDLLDNPDKYEKEVFEHSVLAVKTLRQVIYWNQWL